MAGIMFNKNAMNQQNATISFLMPVVIARSITKQKLQDSLIFI